jgi:hypothetical protein
MGLLTGQFVGVSQFGTEEGVKYGTIKLYVGTLYNNDMAYFFNATMLRNA